LSTLADDLIAAAARLPRDIPALKHQFIYVAGKIRQAQRFVVAQDAREAIRSLLTSRPSSLVTALSFARLPYPICWFEWVPPPDAGPIHIGQNKVAKVGALFEQIGGPLELSFFTAWKFHASVDTDSRLADFPQYLDAARFGISSVAAGFDFSNFERPPTMLGKNGWMQRKVGIAETREQLESARDDKRNSVKWALKSEEERAALISIENRCLYRIMREIGGDELLMIAGNIGGGEYVSSAIKDVSDELGHMIATLVLMNSKNCVEVRPVEPPAKLNKARLKQGKTELLPYSTVEITLNRAAQRAGAGASASEREAMRLHLVRGHFKVRKTGVFWWHHFMRGDETRGVVERKAHTITAEHVR
jgi:hypothetical protein